MDVNRVHDPGSAGVLAGESGTLFNLVGETPALPGQFMKRKQEDWTLAPDLSGQRLTARSLLLPFHALIAHLGEDFSARQLQER